MDETMKPAGSAGRSRFASRRARGLVGAVPALAAVAAAIAALAAFSAGSEPPAAAPWQRLDLAQRPFDLEVASGARPEIRVQSASRRLPAAFEGRSWSPSEVLTLRQAVGSRLAWRVELGGEPYLAVTPLGAQRAGCRGTLRIALRDSEGGEHELLRQPLALAPLAAPAERAIDLGGWSGETVAIVFEVAAAAGAPPERRWRPCRGVWGAPAVVHRAGLRPPPPAAAAPPNVVLLGLDTFRADHWTSRPAGRPTATPALDRLAAESDVWLEATSTFNNTNPSFISIHTGLYGRSHGIYDLSTPLPEERTTLAERFRAAGYATAAVVAARHLLPPASGLGQGFDEMHGPAGYHMAASQVVDRGIAWLAGRREPFFLWLHAFDVHTPTLPPEPYASGMRAAAPSGMAPVPGWAAFRRLGPRSLVDTIRGGHPDLYAGEAAFLDRQVDRLLGFLRSSRLLDRTFVVVVADHGESLGEHGILHQHLGLYEPSVHVPLVVRWPDAATPRGLAPGVAPGSARGRRFRGLVQTVDLAPTLLAATGMAPAAAGAGLEGKDLWRLVGADGVRGSGRPAVVAEHANREGAMIRTRRHKYIVVEGAGPLPPGIELYDLAADPGETVNLAGRGLPAEARLARALADWRAAAAAPATAPRVPPAEELASLRALGYID